jgi:hypothetical protein
MIILGKAFLTLYILSIFGTIITTPFDNPFLEKIHNVSIRILITQSVLIAIATIIGLIITIWSFEIICK